jgi:hypothetical protein
LRLELDRLPGDQLEPEAAREHRHVHQHLDQREMLADAGPRTESREDSGGGARQPRRA